MLTAITPTARNQAALVEANRFDLAPTQTETTKPAPISASNAPNASTTGSSWERSPLNFVPVYSGVNSLANILTEKIREPIARAPTAVSFATERPTDSDVDDRGITITPEVPIALPS